MLLAAAALAGCGGRPASHPVAAAVKLQHPLAAKSAAYQVGLASFYSDKLAGRKTASGEPYNPRALTAAHRSLAIGTVVEVVHGGARVQVRINDRGPFVKGRVLDLSRRAAKELGIERAGVAEVAIYVVSVPRKAPALPRRAAGRT